MRATLSTPRRPGLARATRRQRSSRIGGVVGASREITNLTAAVARKGNQITNLTAVARKGNQITNLMVDGRVGVQAVAEAVNNASTRLVTEFGEGVISHGFSRTVACTQRLERQQ